MPEWWTYSLADFLMFAPRTYDRLFELHNRAVWPAHALAMGSGVILLGAMRGREPWRGRVAAAMLAAAWLWIAWSFHLQRYAAINWAAPWFAAAFALQALLLAWMGLLAGRIRFREPSSWRGRAGAALVGFALLGLPLIAPLSGRSWAGAEVFAIAPDPTVMATIGALLAASAPRVLALVPALWCAVSGATLLAMASPAAAICFAGVGLAVVAAAPAYPAPTSSSTALP